MASISRRPRRNGTVAWRVQFRLSPGGKPTTETFESYEDAQNFSLQVDRIGGQAAQRKRNQQDAGIGAAGPTLSDALEDYIARAHHITEGTKSDYTRIFKRSGISEQLGDIPVRLLTDDDVHAWLRDRSTVPSEQTGELVAVKTLRNEHGLLSTVCAHAVAREWATMNVARQVKLPKAGRAHPLVLTDEQYKAIHAKIPERYQPVTEFLAVTGVRWGEATALQWRDINTSVTPPRVTIRRAWKRGQKTSDRVAGLPKTSAGNRTFTIPQRLIERLGDRGDSSDLVFPNTKGNRLSHQHYHDRAWVPACEAAGVTDPRPRIHDLRHYMASTLLAAGVPIHAVSRRLGHESITTTVNIYSFLTPDMQVAGLDRMEGMLLPAPQIAS